LFASEHPSTGFPFVAYSTSANTPDLRGNLGRVQDRKRRPDDLVCISKLPATKFDTLKMAVRFLVLHRARSIRLVTEGLRPKPFHGRIVMLVNEHTLSAGEMVAAFAKGQQARENPRHADRWPGAQGGRTFQWDMASYFDFQPPDGTRGAAISLRAKAFSLMSRCRSHRRGFEIGRTISSRRQSLKLEACSRAGACGQPVFGRSAACGRGRYL
jgi:hypothetical protein